MAGKQVTELDALPSFTDTSLLPVHNGAGLKKGTLSQLASYLGTKFSNPNLLINPDFKINQRGATSYTNNGYTVDRWRINSGTVRTSSSGITVTLNNKGQFIQQFESTLSGTYTATIKVTSITGDCVLSIGSHYLQLNKAGTFTITENGSISGISLYKNTAGTCTINVEYIKLEQGSVATPFVVPNLSDELKKCESYYTKIELKDSNLIVAGVNDAYIYAPHIEMRTKPTLSLNKATIKFWNFTESDVNKAKTVNITPSKIVQSQGYDDVISFRGSFGSQPLQFGRIISSDSDFTVIKLDAEIY